MVEGRRKKEEGRRKKTLFPGSGWEYIPGGRASNAPSRELRSAPGDGGDGGDGGPMPKNCFTN
jgi:hypothetical protein